MPAAVVDAPLIKKWKVKKRKKTRWIRFVCESTASGRVLRKKTTFFLPSSNFENWLLLSK